MKQEAGARFDDDFFRLLSLLEIVPEAWVPFVLAKELWREERWKAAVDEARRNKLDPRKLWAAKEAKWQRELARIIIDRGPNAR